MNKRTITYNLSWEQFDIEVNYCPEWSTGHYKIAHLEIRNINGQALPITETGYRSHFLHPEIIEEEGGAIAYVRKWLELEAKANKWKNQFADMNQFKLF